MGTSKGAWVTMSRISREGSSWCKLRSYDFSLLLLETASLVDTHSHLSIQGHEFSMNDVRDLSRCAWTLLTYATLWTTRGEEGLVQQGARQFELSDLTQPPGGLLEFFEDSNNSTTMLIVSATQ